MKQFQNLFEVIRYNTNCPFCSAKMQPGMDLIYDENSVKAYLKFGDNRITVDADNNILQVEEVSGINTLYTFQNAPTFQYVSSTHLGLSSSGVDIRRLNVSCEDCSKYSYLVQVHVSLEKHKIVGLYLNSETVSIEEGDVLHEIKNVYAVEKTEYDKFSRVEIHNDTSDISGWSGRRNGTITFPLMSTDFKDPDKLLQRIKNLIIYT